MKKPDRRRVTTRKTSNRRKAASNLNDRYLAQQVELADIEIERRRRELGLMFGHADGVSANEKIAQASVNEVYGKTPALAPITHAPIISPFERLAMAHDGVAMLEARIMALVDKLVGSEPPSQDAANAAPVPMGIIHDVSARAENISRIVSRSHEAIDRLYAVLP